MAGTGPGTINLTGYDDTIYFEGNQTFNNATINLGSRSGYYDSIYNDDTNDTGSVLTLGPNVTVNQALGETSGYAELSSTGSNYAGDGIVNEGTINAQAVNGSFYIEPYNFTNQGMINVSNGDTLYIEPTTFTNNGTIAISGGTVDITTAILGTGNFSINGGTLELNSSDAQRVTFSGAGGTLVVAQPSTFTGEIAGISGSSDVLDLRGLNSSPTDTFSTSTTYNSAAGTTLLTVTDSTEHTSASVTLEGNYTSANGITWTATSDGNGGADVVDPPAPASSDNGSQIWGFNLKNDQIKLAVEPTQTRPHCVSGSSGDALGSISTGGPGNDNFVFHLANATDASVHWNTQQDAGALDHFSDAQMGRQLALFIASADGDAMAEYSYHDASAPPDMATTQLQQIAQAHYIHVH